MKQLPTLDYQMLFERSPACLLVLDPDFRIVALTNAYAEATMTDTRELVGQNMFEVFPDNPLDATATGTSNLRASLERVIDSGAADAMPVQKYDIRRPTAEGSGFEVRYWSCSNWPITDEVGNLRLIVHAAEDVTDLFHRDRIDRQAPKEVQRPVTPEFEGSAEIGRLIRELRATNEELKRAGTAKSEFLSRMSHELRTPFTAVLGFGELLNLSDLDAEQHEMCTSILKAARYLLHMLDDILDMSSIEAGHLSVLVESVQLGELVADTIALIQPLAKAHEIVVGASDSGLPAVHVAADPQRLRQVLINLLSNAIKYNRTGGTVTVAVAIDERSRVRIDIIDTGIGIPADRIERLFVPFDRLDAPDRGIEGTGLGLALSRQLAENMGATLGVSSKVGLGSTFSLELPLVEPGELADLRAKYQATVDIRDYNNARHVLCVEDSAADTQLIERILLRRPAVRSTMVTTGGAALSEAKNHPPDLIILDLNLPDMRGDDVLAQLRADPTTKDVPIVILSADASKDQMHELLDSGANGYLTKPVGVKELLEAVDLCLDERFAV